MIPPLPRLVWRGWTSRRIRTLLAVGGIALGVAVLLAVRVANFSAVEAFSRTLEMVAGRADIEVFASGEEGMDPALFAPFTRMEEIEAATPAFMLRGYAGTERRGVRMLGVDMARDSRVRPWYEAELSSDDDPLTLFSTPTGVLMTPALASELGLKRGDRFPFHHSARTDTLTLIGLLKGESVSQARSRDVVVMDLPRAWQFYGGPHVLHRIDLILGPSVVPDEALAAIRQWLPEGVIAERSGWHRPQAQKMLASFRLNLTALAFVALMVAGFLVFQTVSTTALQQRKTAGILRSVGASRRFVRNLFLFEGLSLGVLGAAVGVPLGLLLARGAVRLVSQSISSIYLLEGTQRIFVTAESVLSSVLLGIGVSLLSVWPVAVEASSVPPRESRSNQQLEQRFRYGWIALAGLVLLLVAAVLTRWPVLEFPVRSGYFAAALMVFGTALTTPWLLGALHRIVTGGYGRWLGSSVRLALGVLVRSRHRITPAVAGLATAVAMWLSVDMMVRSFRGTVDNWITSTITADLVVTAGGSFSVGKRDLMPIEIYDYVHDASGLADTDFFKSVRVEIEGLPTTVAMVDMASVRRQGRLSFLETPSGEATPLDPLVRGDNAVLISEPLSFRANLHVGDTLRFISPLGEEHPVISGVYHDYSSDAGLVLTDRSWYMRRWPDPRLESVAAYLPEGMPLAEGRRIVQSSIPDSFQVEVFSNRDLRSGVLKVFDATFAITYALEAVAIAVALLAISGAMATLVRERKRELALLRSIGGSKKQIMSRVLTEAGLIGLTGWGLGALLGAALSVVLIFVINRYSFGWSLDLILPPGSYVLSLVLMVSASLLAGYLPARTAANAPVAEGISIEQGQ